MDANNVTQQSPTIVLGAGYTGKFLCEIFSRSGVPFLGTSRDPDTHLTHIAPHQRLHFDLTRRETWNNLPSIAAFIWCFPAAPLEFVQEFSHVCRAHERRLVVLGSTSAYDISGDDGQSDPPPWIDEQHPVNMELPRVMGEEYLRTQCKAIVLRIAGIYGPGRNVLNWIRHGRVADSKKYVNLIHVEDLARICLAALERGNPGEIYNVSDGEPRQWTEICLEADRRWNIPIQKKTDDRERGKRISIDKLHMELNYSLHHPDLYQALEQLEE